MISKKQFMKLIPGDVILFNGRPRTIRDISWKYSKWGWSGMITFSILARSWTGKICTTYTYNDIKKICSIPRKPRNNREVCQAEESSLVANGFDVEREVDKEISLDEWLRSRGIGQTESSRKATALLKNVKRKLKRRKS